LTKDGKRSSGFGKRLRKFAGRVGMIVWILICVGCWFLGVSSIWRSYSFASVTYEKDMAYVIGDSHSHFLFNSEGGAMSFYSQFPTRPKKAGFAFHDKTTQWKFGSRPGYRLSPIQVQFLEPVIVNGRLVYYRYLPPWLAPRCYYHLSEDNYRVYYPPGEKIFDQYVSIRLPWWMILTILHAPLPFVFRARRKRRRSENNLCMKCGYDLRGSSGRCSECGRVF